MNTKLCKRLYRYNTMNTKLCKRLYGYNRIGTNYVKDYNHIDIIQ